MSRAGRRPAPGWGALCLIGILSHSVARGAETLRVDHYQVPAGRHAKLCHAINAVSPIRVDGQIFHGYTSWEVRWRFRYEPRPDGRCVLSAVNVDLHARMQLPQLVDATAKMDQQFQVYVRALETHERGHYLFGQRARHDVETHLLALNPEASCAALEARANRDSQAIIARLQKEEKSYDQQTRAGATQGAKLDCD